MPKSRKPPKPVSDKRAACITASRAGNFPAAETPAPPGIKNAAARKRTGFSRDVKLQVRTRAGQGDADSAVCECCGIWLGRYEGQVQHVVARGMGGTSNPVLGTAANGALLCGTPQSGDHGLAESRNTRMRAKGFWLPQGTDPRLVSMTLWTGVRVWRAEDGKGPDGTGYLYEAPGSVAA